MLVAGAPSKGQPAAFAVQNYGFATRLSVPKSLRVFITRCGDLVAGDKHVPLEKVGAGRGKVCGRLMRKSYNDRCRAHGNQGRHKMCPELRYELFQWFLDIRKVVKGRLWACHVVVAANNIVKNSAISYRPQTQCATSPEDHRGLDLALGPGLRHLASQTKQTLQGLAV